jgi:hypothetical protein
MNAVLCVSATHLNSLPPEKRAHHLSLLPAFSADTAIYYHTEAIRPLARLTAHSADLRNEDLLAAIVLLRWHEEVDAPLRAADQDSELFLRVKNLLITEQFKSPQLLSHSPPVVQQQRSPSVNIAPETDGSFFSPGVFHESRPMNLRQASFWVAFRQEIYTCLLKERSFAIPLSRCAAFRSFEAAEDAVWANRLIVFCADCIEFCYGSIEVDDYGKTIPTLPKSSPDLSRSRWIALKALEGQWEEHLPSSFDPIYSTATEFPEVGFFPELWYVSTCHVTGLQHLELARILLALYDPLRPKVGPGYLSHLRELSASIRNIVRRLCGMALGNQRVPPSLATACLAIAMYGGHFEERHEQEALLDILRNLRVEHGWPFGNTAENLKEAWGWNPP